MLLKKINAALISAFDKDNLAPIIKKLAENQVTIYATAGTQKFIEEQGVAVTAIENLTSYPSIFGGRVKTLHPKVFGGILHRRDLAEDINEANEFKIPAIDLVIVDLYPFEETVASGVTQEEIIEKIDIGGISLIRAAAKNFKEVAVVSSKEQYRTLESILSAKTCCTDLSDRRRFATEAFDISSSYDTAIFNYFNKEEGIERFKQSERKSKVLRYGENFHQKGVFYGNLENIFDQLSGKDLSYNNLVDVDAAINLIEEFSEATAFAILKHTNACGVATANTVKEAYLKALAADPVSAFGGVLVTNKTVDLATAKELHELFFEVLICREFTEDALMLLKKKKNRILLVQKQPLKGKKQFKKLLNGVVEQDRDLKTEGLKDLKTVTERMVSKQEIAALLFANKVVKHTKSNAIVLAENGQLFASGIGQTSRVDALMQAIKKAKHFGFDLSKAVMASDAFFPFPDCVEIAGKEGITAIIQPGGSIKDKDSIAYCNANRIAMVFTETRHFKH